MYSSSIVAFVAFAALLLAPMTASSAGADKIITHAGTEYVVPANSPVRKPTFGTGDDITARFDGKFALSGILHFEGFPDAPMVFLKPDANIAARLPRWKVTGRPSAIWFVNSSAVVSAALPADTLADLKAHRISVANQHVVLDVDRYTVAIECDTANYYVRFVSVHTPGVVAQNVEQEEGC
jgi:hypothetical protein